MPATLAPENATLTPAVDVAGSIEEELLEQHVSDQTAHIGGMPSLSTLPCVTSSIEVDILPRM